MNITTIGTTLQTLVADFDPATFIYDFLLAYNLPKASISRLQKGNLNLAKNPNEIIWKKKLHFKAINQNADLLDNETQDIHQVIDQLKLDPATARHAPRFIIVTDYVQLLALDTKTHDSLDVTIADLPRHLDFFLPWAGMEKTTLITENIADVKAARNMAKLYDLINFDNPATTDAQVHALNVFLSRLLFCFFAEDTAIFKPSQFTQAVSDHTQADGSDLQAYLEELFTILNTAPKDRASNLPQYLSEFEYVNGGLFRDDYPVPTFNRKSRDLIITLGSLDWAAINPDIFGSMIQAVVLPAQRGSLGMHYTSVPNIMKVIEPLFLDDLNAAFEEAKFSPKKLNALLERISQIKIFDPACGSGNFLIIAYKQLCAFEIKILQQLQTFEGAQASLFSRIELAQFYGIEIDDFAHEVAILSLWLAQHQMNLEFKALFGSANPTLPLAPSGNIVHGNACRVDWNEVCPKKTDDEVYILGNPPYLGSKNLDDKQREDMQQVFSDKGALLDYITAWFFLASIYSVKYNVKFAFVTTNSICQGEQVSIIWPKVLNANLEIFFAYKSFKWENNAKHKAAVTIAVVGVQNKQNKLKNLYANGSTQSVENINPYLLPAKTIYVDSRSKPISRLPPMIGGNVAYDSGHLIFTAHEMSEFLKSEPHSKCFFKKIMGGQELLNGGVRYCLWLKNYSPNDFVDTPLISKRIDKVRAARLAAKDLGTHRLAERSHQFRDLNNPAFYIAIPKTSSERREYIPSMYLDQTYIPADSVRIIANPETYVFSLISSKIHMVWIKVVSGRLKTDYRYSKNISYNTFPFPLISDKQKAELEQSAYRILEAREQHTEKTLAQMYDPDKMPANLRAAHEQNDLAVERCYRSALFTSDEERLAYLFKMYEQMIADEQKQSDLLAVPRKKSRK